MPLGKAHFYFSPLRLGPAAVTDLTHSSAPSALSIRANVGWFWSKNMSFFGRAPSLSDHCKMPATECPSTH